MDIENLNRTQIVLLTLLVSFVTSIATGIVTVTLMDQAPPAVTQTILKVVEKTIENVIPEKNQAAIVTRETIIVKERNSIAEAIEENQDSFVRINKKIEDGNVFVSLGVFVHKSGIILTSSEDIKEDDNYSILTEENIDLEIIKIDSDKKIAYLKVKEKEERGIFKPMFKTINITDSNSLKLGQSIFSLSGVQTTEVLTGIISGLIKDKITIKNEVTENELTGDGGEKKNINPKDILLSENNQVYVSEIKTNISGNITNGSILFDLEGDMIGINVDSNISSFIPLSFVKEDLQNILTHMDEEKKIN